MHNVGFAQTVKSVQGNRFCKEQCAINSNNCRLHCAHTPVHSTHSKSFALDARNTSNARTKSEASTGVIGCVQSAGPMRNEEEEQLDGEGGGQSGNLQQKT